MNINFDKAQEFVNKFQELEIKREGFTPFAENIESVLSEERLTKIQKNGDLFKARKIEDRKSVV